MLTHKVLWISWERHRRTRELAKALGVELQEFCTNAPRWLKHPYFLAKTFGLLAVRRPDILVVQCPSSVLALFALLIRPILRYRLVVDAHNELIDPFLCRRKFYIWLTKQIQRGSDLLIVSNAGLRSRVERNGAKAEVLPDRLPEWGYFLPAPKQAKTEVVFICTYAPDEPVQEVVDAAQELPDGVQLYVTGRIPASAQELLRNAPANVRFTGYLEEAAYASLLHRADVLVDLTDMDDCLVCGAYEAVSLKKPLVVTDTVALRSYFSMGSVYCRNDRGSISRSIREALEKRGTLAAEMRVLRELLQAQWVDQANHLLCKIQALAAPTEVANRRAP